MRFLKALMILFVISSFLSFGQETEMEKIHEKVDVTNVEVPVRVFLEGKPVAGLNKENFKLFINGKEHRINAFYEVRKKIEVDQPDQELSPRLFVLIFNVSDYHPFLIKNIDLFFDKIIRPKDRLIIMSNNFFLDDRTIINLKKEKSRLKKLLDIEAKRMKTELYHLRSKLRSLLEDKNDRSEEAVINDRIFVQDYIQYLKGFKKTYFDMQNDQYVKIARYLKEQRIEKWVFNFYQLGMFFYPDFLENLIGGVDQRGEFAGVRTIEKMELYTEAINELQKVNKSSMEDIGKLFINSGATFHTQLMRSRNQFFLDGYKYKPITLESENIFLEATGLSGGIIAKTNKIKTFLKKVTSTEDIYYMLTFDPPDNETKNQKIKLTVDNKKYRVSYDDQERSRALLAVTKKIAKEVKHILLENLDLKARTLSFTIANIKLVPVKESKTVKGNVLLKIKIMDSEANNLFARELKIKMETERKEFNIGKFPQLKKGTYDIIVEAHDINTGKNDLAITGIKIEKDKQKK